MANTELTQQLPLAALLRAARAAMATAIRSALERAGYDDLPANGPYVISATSVAGVPLAVIIGRLGLSKQAAGHLVDVLVLRGYLERRVDPEDRRRLVVLPTERGVAAGLVIRDAAERVEARLAVELSESDLEVTRRTLSRLATMSVDDA